MTCCFFVFFFWILLCFSRLLILQWQKWLASFINGNPILLCICIITFLFLNWVYPSFNPDVLVSEVSSLNRFRKTSCWLSNNGFGNGDDAISVRLRTYSQKDSSFVDNIYMENLICLLVYLFCLKSPNTFVNSMFCFYWLFNLFINSQNKK